MGLAWAAVALLGACGDEGAGPAPGELAVTPEGYCEVFFEPLCERQIGCNFALVNQATSVEQCIQEAGRLCSPELKTWLQSLRAGRTTFSVEAVEACGAAVAAARCQELASGLVPEACGEIFVGAVGLKQDCFTDVECEAGLICASAGRCPGLCEVPDRPPEVFNCTQVGCPEGEFCLAGSCAAKLAEGEGCPNDDAACDEGLFCGKDVGEPELRCRVKKEQGERCFARSFCREGLSCQIIETDPAERTCEPERASGGDCFDGEECAPGLVCDQNGGTCVVPRAEEERCFDVFDCGPGLYCWEEFIEEPGVGICRENQKVGVGEGQPCNPLVDRCRLGLFCRMGEIVGVGECAVLPDIGEACADFSRNLNEECRTGDCVFVEGGQRCIEKGDAGAVCGSGQECLSTSCREGICAAFEEVFCSLGDP